NGKPVNVTEQARNNVVIAATGTGVTLTATPQGEGDDADGHYWKYSLQPDTASYATQAIRYNTVTVQVNGTKIGTEYHAAWSPDIALGGGDSLPYTMDEVQDIINTCTDPILVLPQNGYPNKLVYTSLPASTRIQCGTDLATATRPYITLVNATAPTEATINATVTGAPAGQRTDGARVEAAAPGKNKSFSMAVTLNVKLARTGGVRYDGNVFIVKGQPKYPFANATKNGHPAATYTQDLALSLTDVSSPNPPVEYRYDPGHVTATYMQYYPVIGATVMSDVVRVSVSGNYDVADDATGTTAKLDALDGAVKVSPGADALGRASNNLVVAYASNVSACGAGSVSRILWSAPGQTAYTCVGTVIANDETEVQAKFDADDLFGSATHPALSGVWQFYMDVR
ncbi:TPA: hypothetical protein MGM98_004784, partial [Salmonella enterica]|nr:hypothetical protein [Salmonella enterica]